jgi:hypothetical protein
MKKGTTKAKRQLSKSPRTKRDDAPADYVDVLADLKQLIADSRRRALATVNRELVCLYWNIGRAIVQQQETAQCGDAVVEQLAHDLRLAFPDMKGLTKENLFRTRKFYLASREIHAFLDSPEAGSRKVATVSPQINPTAGAKPIMATVSPQLAAADPPSEKISTMSRVFFSKPLTDLLTAVSWSHHKEIILANLRDFFLEFDIPACSVVGVTKPPMCGGISEPNAVLLWLPAKLAPTKSPISIHSQILPVSALPASANLRPNDAVQGSRDSPSLEKRDRLGKNLYPSRSFEIERIFPKRHPPVTERVTSPAKLAY